MRHQSEYRRADLARSLAEAIARRCTRPWTLMEVCGGQTHGILKYGVDRMLPEGVELIHGPGCPVCVTPLETIDKAIEIAHRPNAILCSFGDMLRVPGSRGDLLLARAEGADVRALYSPLDALRVARENPDREVVFFSVGFETTAPATAMAVWQARQSGLRNFSLLVSHVRVPPAMDALLNAPECRIQGFLAAGHVCTVMGVTEYEPIAEARHIPIVVTGFEPVDLLAGIYRCIEMLESGQPGVENEYRRMVRREGNQAARKMMSQVFQIIGRAWRGLGVIPRSGLGLAEDYANFDAEGRFQLSTAIVSEPEECQSGRVLQGLIKPDQCPAFGNRCTPEHPLGATMVSSEGACAAYHRYRPSGQH